MTRHYFQTRIAEHVWRSKYRYHAPGGSAEKDIGETWRRVAAAVAAPEDDPQHWNREFDALLEGFRFLPAGRILAGAGTAWDRTLFNCFVMGIIEDSLDGIFDHLKEGAVTMQWGGGVGYDFSTLRPAGYRTNHVGGIASGPVSFMRVWDAMCATVLSTGARRGAMMGTLRCDHPDILPFVDAKREPGVLTNFNLSVQVPDALMLAVSQDQDWPLCFPADGSDAGETLQRAWTGSDTPVRCRIHGHVRAQELWRHIMTAAWDSAEPGVLFVDAVARENNLHYRERITTTNPCGEIPLPPYGACNLGSLNLTCFVRDAFGRNAELDTEALRRTVPPAVRFLDDVIDASRFPLEAQRAQARGSRRIGLGVTGLGDTLAMLGVAYDSDEGRERAREWLTLIRDTAYRASVDMAREKGSFPFYETEPYLDGRYIRRLPADIRDAIAAGGIRNSHLLAIAPTGTISLLAGNVSSGIEPIFSLEGHRRVLDESGDYRNFDVTDCAYAHWREHHGRPQTLPDAFRCSRDIAPRDHLAMQAALQDLVDNAISKTINVPEDCSREDFEDIYLAAWRLGLKGCTVFRPNPVRGAVLTADAAAEPLPVHCCDIEREAD
ncbi:MAG: adenosylcobalamin-dependent ribonucleoside-diphosphate reductase [Gammaproteobacteria bacterium]